MNLSDLFKTKQYNTDKNREHAYIDHLYNDLFVDNQKVTNLLEIGIYEGGSIKLWRDYFINAQIDAVDIRDCSSKLDSDRIKCMVSNAYNKDFVKTLPLYDIIIDDGSHALHDMIFLVNHYSQLLKDDGMLVIEDVPDYNWFEILKQHTPEDFTYEIIDLRPIKHRFDDMLFILRRKTK